MSQDTISRANSLGSAINNWTKIIVGMIIMIIGVGTTYYKIQSNAADNVRQDQQFDKILETMTREFQVQSQEQEKLTLRFFERIGELHEIDVKLWQKSSQQDKEILDLYKEIYYIKGKMSAEK